MSKAVAAKTETHMTVSDQHMDVGGEEILSSTLVIPRLLLMQGQSEFVKERRAQDGDFVRTTPYAVLGGPSLALEFIPITFSQQWKITELIGKKWEFRGYEAMTHANQDAEWEFEKGGTTWKRTKTLNCFALLPADIIAEREELAKAAKGEAADPDKALLPIMISFRSTSFPAGKVIATHFQKAKKFNQPGYVSTLRLTCRLSKNDLGSFYVLDVASAAKPVSKEDQAVASYWYGILKTKAVQVEAEVEETEFGAGYGGAKEVDSESKY